MKDFFVEDAVRFENTTVTTYFVLSSMQVRDKKQGGQYLALIVSDKTGSLEARMWDDVADPIEFCSEGCYVKVQGDISKYSGKFQITLKKLRLAADSEIDPKDFQPATKFDVEEMWGELRGYVSAFRNEDLKRLVFSFLDDEKIGPAFKSAPAAKRLHHAWLGGLLEHVLTLVRVCLAAAPFYPEVDLDLLVTGAKLDDIRKALEAGWKSSFSYTLERQMSGSDCMAPPSPRERVRELAPFPEKLRV